MVSYSCGNEWLKWDLHLHCPGTILNNQYKGKNEDEIWEKFISMIEKSDISVLGITDYYSIDGYLKVKKFKEEGRLKNVKAIFPNIEVRLNVGAQNNRFINYHIIFSPEIDDKINDEFIKQLVYCYKKEKFTFTKKNIIELGKKIEGKDCKNPFEEGTKYFKVHLENINNILNSKNFFKDKFFTVVAGGTKDGVDALLKPDDQGKGVRLDILSYSDGVFTTNEKSINKYLMKEATEKNRKNIYVESPKPCFQGSDSHSFNHDFGEKWTWIKAEPSFNGLLQTKFEPERRVKESRFVEKSPIQLNSNQWIKSIDLGDNKMFQEEVLFNPGLNTIIGGKSSGKSILLYQIAKGGGEKNFEKIRKFREYTFNEYTDLDKVFRYEPKLSLGNGKDVEDEFKINYYPQLFINRISEDYTNDELQEIIKNSFKNNQDVSTRIDNFINLKKKVKNNLLSQIDNYTNIMSEIDKSKEEIRQLGDIDDLKKNLEDEKKKYKSLQLEINLDKDEQVKYDNYKQKRNSFIKNKKNNEIEIKGLISQESSIKDFINALNSNFENIIIEKKLKELLKPALAKFNDFLEEKVENIDQKISDLNNEVKNEEKETELLKSEILPILSKYDRRSELTNCEKSKEQIENNIIELEREKKSLKNNTDYQDKILKKIENEIKSFIENAEKNAKCLNGEKIGTDLSLNTRLVFNQKAYRDNIISKFDGRSLSSVLGNGIEDEDKLGKTNMIDFPSLWKESICETLNHQFDNKLRHSFNPHDLAISLADLPIEMPININKENDDLSKMSPGKRAIVVLELLLENDSSDTSPILIDQPEDNLDNRSISHELVALLKKVSLRRQVIIVTHNANLVVLADADEVIVANQDPEILENEKYRFEYITGSLENSTGYTKNSSKISSKGIRDDITDILEGGVEAFKTREKKYLLE